MKIRIPWVNPPMEEPLETMTDEEIEEDILFGVIPNGKRNLDS